MLPGTMGMCEGKGENPVNSVEPAECVQGVRLADPSMAEAPRGATGLPCSAPSRSQPMGTERAEPVLAARTLDQTRAFYDKRLCCVVGRPGTWAYEIVSRGQLVVQFFADAELKPDHHNSSCYWRVQDADRCIGSSLRWICPPPEFLG